MTILLAPRTTVPNLLAVTSPPYHLLRRILDNTTAACFRSADLYPRNRVDPGTLLAAAKGPTSGHSAGQASIAALCRNRPLTLCSASGWVRTRSRPSASTPRIFA